MANQKLTDLTQIASISSSDEMLITDVDAATGEKSKKVLMSQLDDRLNPAGQTGITNLGEMFQNDNAVVTTIDTLDVWEQVLNFSVGEIQFTTFDSDSIQVTNSGRYQTICSVSMKMVSGGSKDIELAFSINDAIQAKTRIERNFDTSLGAVTITGVLNLSSDDIVKLEVRNRADTVNILVVHSSFNIHSL